MKSPLSLVFKRPLPWLIGGVVVGLVAIAAIVPLALRNRTTAYDLNAYTVEAQSDALKVRVTASGTVQPVQTVNLSPKNAGILAELYVEQGDTVSQGQMIARMDNDDLQAELRQGSASLAEAQAQLQDVRDGNRPGEISQAAAAVDAAAAQLRDAEARLALAENRLARNRELAAQGALSQNDLDGFINENRSAVAGVEQAQSRLSETQERLADLRSQPETTEIDAAAARVARAQAQLEAIQVRLEDTVIRAPFTGIITQKFATVGAFVTPTTSASDATSATSTAIVALADGLEILAEVPEADIDQIYPGQSVEIQADAFPDDTFNGTVHLIAPEAVEQQNVTLFQVRIDLDSGIDRLLSNMNVDVAFIGEAIENAIVVPTVAIITQNGQAGVIVPGENNRLRFRPVTLGSQAGDDIQILDGVDLGDRVFIDLPPGQRLENLTFGQEGTPSSE